MKLTPQKKKKAAAILSRLIEKCGGPGGSRGPCPGAKRNPKSSPSTGDADRKRRVDSIHARFASALAAARSAPKKHTVKLPKDPKKLTFDQASRAMKQMGHNLKLAPYDVKKKKAMYQIEFSDGKKQTVDAAELSKLVYAGS